ncbi:hypothetical protein [uncultured Desulfosarcina sp.]|uniref:hypothetical protein n=1 Tax=uncultured Desulfosarcina sp. TaxID=218289 RepID=UPI0029C80DC0|nr:hypothetical protein [uncultured Desulfosarcina sp.]
MKKKMKDHESKEHWAAMLKDMLDTYRENNPDDCQSDEELLHSLMDYFAESGLIKKKDGKYVIPKIIHDA